jgi:hypothetical protein
MNIEMIAATSNHEECNLPFEGLMGKVPDKIAVVNCAGAEYENNLMKVIDVFNSLSFCIQEAPEWNVSHGMGAQPLAPYDKNQDWIDSYEKAINKAEYLLLEKPSLAAILLVDEDVHKRIEETSSNCDPLGIYVKDANQYINGWLGDKSAFFLEKINNRQPLSIIILFVHAIRKEQKKLQENGGLRLEMHDVLKLVLRHELGHAVDPLLDNSAKYRKECFAQVFCWLTSTPRERAVMQAMHQGLPPMYQTYQAIVLDDQGGESAEQAARLGIGFMWRSESEHFSYLLGLLNENPWFSMTLQARLSNLIKKIKSLSTANQEDDFCKSLEELRQMLPGFDQAVENFKLISGIANNEISLEIKPLTDAGV